MSMTQDSEVGDGTTSVTVLAAELLKEVSHIKSFKLPFPFLTSLLKLRF